MSTEKFDMISSQPFSGIVPNAWKRLRKFDVIFEDGTRGSIRTSKSRKQLLSTGRYLKVGSVKAEPVEFL